MQQVFGIMFFIVFPAVLSGLVKQLIIKEKINVNSFVSYACIDWICISGIKTLLGEYDYTILESFEDNGASTYIHYLIPVILIAIVLPYAIRFVVKHCTCKIEQVETAVVSSVFILSIINIIRNWKVENIYILIAGIVALARVIVIIVRKGSDIFHTNEENKKTIVLQTVSIVLFWAILIFVFIPGKIYVSNASEFHVQYSNYMFTLICGSIIVSVALIEGTLIFLKEEKGFFLTTLFGYTVCCYIQQNFLNGKMQQLDGQSQAWSEGKAYFNAFIWFAIILVFAILSQKQKTLKVIAIVSTYLSLILVFTITYLSLTTDFSKEYNTATTVKLFELDDKNNTIVFVLDWFDEQILEQIVEDDEEFLEPLEGFTWYKNQTSRYAFTYMSIPYLMTGVEWPKDMHEPEYTEYAYTNGHFIHDMNDAGYDVGIYSDSQMIRDYDNEVVNYSNGSVGRCKFWPTIEMMSSCSKYETMPFILKNDYWYTTGDVDEMRVDGDNYDGDNEWFYSTMKSRGITISSDNLEGSFRFYHIWGIHDSNFTSDMVNGPTDIKDCGRNVFRIVFEYIDMLKAKGLYDNTTFIITADHGQNYLNDDDEMDRQRRNVKNTSNPILLVKEAGKSTGFEESEKAVSHDNFFATVLESMHVQNQSYAESYERTEDNKIRYMDYYRYNDIPHRRYKIEGIATDEKSWSVAE